MRAEVVTQHGTKDEVLLGRELVERAGDDEANGIETLLAANIEIEVVLACGLQHEVHVLTAKAARGAGLVLLGTGEQHHLVTHGDSPLVTNSVGKMGISYYIIRFIYRLACECRAIFYSDFFFIFFVPLKYFLYLCSTI